MLRFGRDCSYSLTHETSLFFSFIVRLPNYDIQTFVEAEYYVSFLFVIATSTGVIRYSVVK